MTAVRIRDFDLWRAGYAGAIVTVYEAGTTTPATLYAEPTMATLLNNPQTLQTRQDTNGQTYGKFAVPVYVAVAYTLSIDTGERGGVERPPITALDGADVSLALVTGTRGQEARTLASVVDWSIWAQAFGDLSDAVGAAVCTATLQAAIGAAAAQGGGLVRIPAGNFPFTTLTLPEGVVLAGEGASATTLRSTITAAVITIGGDGAGITDLTLDGVNVNTGSVGVYAINKVGMRFENCLVRRFATGLRVLGAEACRWRNFSISECSVAGDLRGDLDAATSGLGAPFRNIEWNGGAIAFNVLKGLHFRAVDALCENIRLAGLEFEGNLADALILEGVRDLRSEGCWFANGLRGLHVLDNITTPLPAINTSARIDVIGGYFDGAATGMEIKYEGECVNITLRRVRQTNISHNLVSPQNAITRIDCIQDALTTITGLKTYLLSQDTDHGGTLSGVTTGAVDVVAWSEAVPPGKTWLVTAKVTARQRNGTGRGRWWVAAGVDRPCATLAYINLTGTFTVAAILTGATSGASARINANAAGTLTISDITGTFQNGETITDGAATATASGTISTSNAALDSGGSVDVIAPVDSLSGTATDVFVSVSGPSAQVTVRGDTALTIDWVVEIDVLKD